MTATLKNRTRVLSAAAAVTLACSMSGIASDSAQAATTGSWTISQALYNIYSSTNNTSTTFFYPTHSQAPSGSKITKLTVNISPYENGGINRATKICHQKSYSSYDTKCVPGPASGAVTLYDFNGFDAHGSFSIMQTVDGGTFPTTGGGKKNTVTVDWTL